MNEEDRKSRFVGSLVGGLVGCAVGGPCVWMSPSQVRIKYAGLEELIGGGQLGLRPGEITDKGGLLLAVVESLLSAGGYDLEASIRAQLAWLEGWDREVEGGVAEARLFLENGGKPAELPEHLKSVPLGAVTDPGTSPLCRSLGPAYWFPPSPPRPLCEAVIQECSWSRPGEEIRTAGAFLALFLSLLLEGEPLEEKTYRKAEDLLVEADLGLYPMLTDPFSWAPHPDHPTPREPLGLASSVFSLLFRKKGYEETVRTVAGLGGPADTAACLAGALAGAGGGAERIPERWWRRVREVPKARHLALKLAERRA
ncbi:MAG TPA: hypothetical protein ENJ97_00655 [Planctomycetes bacterium]|nr:hypothetical protein [Planctomycetota bacterium]